MTFFSLASQDDLINASFPNIKIRVLQFLLHHRPSITCEAGCDWPGWRVGGNIAVWLPVCRLQCQTTQSVPDLCLHKENLALFVVCGSKLRFIITFIKRLPDRVQVWLGSNCKQMMTFFKPTTFQMQTAEKMTLSATCSKHSWQWILQSPECAVTVSNRRVEN